ncbi:MAG: GNAT family N-acetyltransferase [Saprospiraceae bacterium]|jgi:GNAT superfamily N-acetyltransferase
MITSIKHSEIRLANKTEMSIIIQIIMNSFKSDPHINWLLEKSNNPKKIEIAAEYITDETFAKGEIYLTNDDLGLAFWQTEKKEGFSINFIKRNLSFLFRLGLRTAFRSLKNQILSHSHFPKKKPFYYLALIGVMPQVQGKGLASKLLNPVLEDCKNKKTPVYLETGNKNNVEIYKKKGFTLTDTYVAGNFNIYFMKIA